MSLSIRSVICFFAMTLFTANPIAALADDEHSYEQLSPNGKYVFVMLTKSPDRAGNVDTLKARYHHSGLYKTANPRKSLWRVNWYSARVHVSSDGIHLARVGRLYAASVNGKPNMAQLAVAFYKNGNLTKKYTVGGLVDDPHKLVKSADGFQWQKRVAFDDASERLEVALITGQNRIFDIKSGNMIGRKTAAHKRR